MAREEFDESLYRRPNVENAENGEEDKKEVPPDGAGDAGGDTDRDAGETRSAWDDDEEDADAPVSRRKFMPDDDEPPEEEDGRAAPSKKEKGSRAEGDGRDEGVREKAAAAKKSRGDVRKGRRRITSGASFYGDDEKRTGIRRGLVWALCVVLFIVVALMTLSGFIDDSRLDRPKTAVSRLVEPVQRAFSSFTDSIASYVRMLKIRGELEYEYEQLLLKLDDLASEAQMAKEYKFQLDLLQDQIDEMNRNRNMDPISASVIGHDTGNYFSVLTVDVGSRQGVTENMAVVFSGGLVGYTYNVEENTCNVLCIIDSNATVAAMIQSTRDQGSVTGTLAVDGTAYCRMYYLPDDSLPRPGDLVVTSNVGVEFPKGIPIGYVRESTRGMDANKSFVVVEPIVDFQHLEYVVVYRYRPSYTDPVQKRSSYSEATLIPMSTGRPTPTFVPADADSGKSEGDGTAEETAEATVSPTPEVTATPNVTPTADPNATPTPENLEYQAPESVGGTSTPTPRPSPTPSPSPAPTFDPGSLTVEDDEPL